MRRTSECPRNPLGGPECSSDLHCRDQLHCNGEEVCVANVCQPGTPVSCDPGLTCDEGSDKCIAQPVLLASDAFDDGTLGGGSGWLDAWSALQYAEVYSYSSPYSAPYHLRVRSNGRVERRIDLTGITAPRLKFQAKLSYLKAGDQVHLKVSPDGVTFTTIHIFDESLADNQYHAYDLDLAGFEATSSFVVVFEGVMKSSEGYFYIDDVQITGVQ